MHLRDVLDLERARMLTHSNCSGDLDASLQYPQTKQTDPQPLADGSFVKRIDQSGFTAALYNK
jgi:hypothetical protein